MRGEDGRQVLQILWHCHCITFYLALHGSLHHRYMDVGVALFSSLVLSFEIGLSSLSLLGFSMFIEFTQFRSVFYTRDIQQPDDVL